jgi:predicted transcriptional regulator
MGVTKDRSRWEIILDVLKAIQEDNKAKKTRIMQRAYLDWRNFDRYFSFLLEEGFIKRTPDTYYRLTEKGEGLLTRLQEVDEIAGSKWRAEF